MISMVFGLPRAGKTTFLAYTAKRALAGKPIYVGRGAWRRYLGEEKTYKRVYSNFPLQGCYELDWDALGKVDFSNCLILIDEIMHVCDSREWKDFPAEKKYFFSMHGHAHCDIVACSQHFRDCDVRIRNLTEQIFYIEKFGAFTRISPVQKGWRFNEDIQEGYELAPPLSRTYILRKRYYCLFDSFAMKPLPENPAKLWA